MLTTREVRETMARISLELAQLANNAGPACPHMDAILEADAALFEALSAPLRSCKAPAMGTTMRPCMATMRKAMNGDSEAQRCMYLDYVNDFLTVAGFSAHYGISQASGNVYIKWWREVHEEHCAQAKARSGHA